MINGNSYQLGEVSPMAVDTRAADTGLSHDTFTAMVGQMVVQCKALLRQQARAQGNKTAPAVRPGAHQAHHGRVRGGVR